MHRHKMSKHKSKHQFKRSAAMVHRKNLVSGAQTVNRGGIRL